MKTTRSIQLMLQKVSYRKLYLTGIKHDSGFLPFWNNLIQPFYGSRTNVQDPKFGNIFNVMLFEINFLKAMHIYMWQHKDGILLWNKDLINDFGKFHHLELIKPANLRVIKYILTFPLFCLDIFTNCNNRHFLTNALHMWNKARMNFNKYYMSILMARNFDRNKFRF